ncbi:MAG: hypothetical protein ACQETH_09090 [Candidatus Rifleibacteriota bacterium]
MKCKEFRKQILNDGEDMQSLEKHLNKCDECALWLNKELKNPPEGFSKAEWQSATARCMPDTTEISNNTDAAKQPESENNDKSLFAGFLNGLKYGIVFGLSIITAIAVIQLQQNHIKENNLKPAKIQSFLEDTEKELPSFYEKNFSDVTFYEYEDSKLLSFVDKNDETDPIPSFIEETTQEEDLWYENNSG